MSIADFKIIKALSSGAYGRVCLVQKINSGDYFAMKIIDRAKTMEKKQEDYISSEVNILAHQDSQYIVKLYYTFQNEKYLFFAMEYMAGGDLGNLLKKVGCLDIAVSCLPRLIFLVGPALPRRNRPRSRTTPSQRHHTQRLEAREYLDRFDRPSQAHGLWIVQERV